MCQSWGDNQQEFSNSQLTEKCLQSIMLIEKRIDEREAKGTKANADGGLNNTNCNNGRETSIRENNEEK
jgi:hypothetical protein